MMHKKESGKFFTAPYEDTSLEVRKKMHFLVIFSFIGLAIYIPFMIFSYLFGDHEVLGIAGDTLVPLAMVLILIAVRKGRAELAVNLLMLTILATFINVVLISFVSEWPVDDIREFVPYIIQSQIAQTTLILIFELLIISLFALKAIS